MENHDERSRRAAAESRAARASGRFMLRIIALACGEDPGLVDNDDGCFMLPTLHELSVVPGPDVMQ